MEFVRRLRELNQEAWAEFSLYLGGTAILLVVILVVIAGTLARIVEVLR